MMTKRAGSQHGRQRRQAVASSSSYWPTYMNPDNGGIFPPTTTYSITYMDPNNGAIYPSITTTSSNTRATSISSGNYGADSDTGIEAVGEAYSSISGSSQMDSDMGNYTIPLFTGSSTSIDMNNNTSISPDSASTPTSSASDSSSSAPSPLKVTVAAVPGVVGVALIILGVWLCCRCRKRRRLRREGGSSAIGRYGEMSEVERSNGQSMSSRHPTRPFDAGVPTSLTRDEVQGVVSPSNRSQWTSSDRPDRIDLIYPSLPTRAATARSSGPPPLSAYFHQPHSPAGTFGRVDSRAPSSSRHSRWTDDSEFDVMAEDGSTITRTLSTTSTRRTLGADDTSVRGGPSASASASVLNSVENPFDHPAYTYRAAPQPQRSTTLSSRNTSANGTWSSQPPSLAYNSTLSPISPATPNQESDTYSIHSSEDGIFGGGGALPSARVRPGVRREPTIIRHADSSAAGPGRWSTTVERAGRDDAGVVELPPLYEDATSGWTR